MIISLSLIFQLLLALSREEAFQAVYLLIRLADKIPSRTKAPQEHSIQHKKAPLAETLFADNLRQSINS